jgi:hypothetical protein
LATGTRALISVPEMLLPASSLFRSVIRCVLMKRWLNFICDMPSSSFFSKALLSSYQLNTLLGLTPNLPAVTERAIWLPKKFGALIVPPFTLLRPKVSTALFLLREPIYSTLSDRLPLLFGVVWSRLFNCLRCFPIRRSCTGASFSFRVK